MIDHRIYANNLSSGEIKSGLIRTHDLCDTGAVLYCELIYPANWELFTL